MKHSKIAKSILSVAAMMFLVPACAMEDSVSTETQETHSWGGYHWSSGNGIALGDNVSSAWDSYLGTTSSDWSKSTVVDTNIVTGNASPRNCRPTSGMVEVCSDTYGNTGWLGVAQIWLSGGHISQGTVKVNDTYYASPTYNTPAWRNLVMCQEVGHTLGLDHQDEDFNNKPLGTCMDYSNDPDPNQHPNQHDYSMLQEIYGHSHLNEVAVGDMPAAMANGDFSTPESWGQLFSAKTNGHQEAYVRDFGNGYRIVTFVTWAVAE